jgi:hypothetical protein
MSFEDVEAAIEYRQQHAAREKTQQAAQQAAAQAQYDREKQNAERLRQKLLAITYSQWSATPAEEAHVESLMKQNKPEQYGNPDAHLTMLFAIRNLTDFGH